MIVLCAYYKGDVNPANRKSFDEYVRTVHLPLVADWPKLKKLRLLKNNREPYEGEFPSYYQCIELTYDSLSAFHASLGAPERVRTKEISVRDREQFSDLFEGQVLHAVYRASQIPVREAGTARILRCASYMGNVAPEERARFDAYVRDVHLPDVANWPRLRGLRLLKNEGLDFLGEAPQYYHTFELAFDSEEDMNYCMKAEERKITRRISAGDFATFKGLFNGEVHHTNYSVTEFALPGTGSAGDERAPGVHPT